MVHFSCGHRSLCDPSVDGSSLFRCFILSLFFRDPSFGRCSMLSWFSVVRPSVCCGCSVSPSSVVIGHRRIGDPFVPWLIVGFPMVHS